MFIGSILTILLLSSEIVIHKELYKINIKRVVIFPNSLFHQSINVEKTLSSDLNFDWINSVINSYSFTRQILTWKLKHHQQFFTAIAAARIGFPWKNVAGYQMASCCIFFFFCIDQILYHKHPSTQCLWKGI